MKNFKKVLALVLVLATLLGLATMASATEFKDADKIDASYEEAIKVLDLIETMQGYPNGEFKPTATITREEAAKVIAIFDNKDSDISTYYTSINPFADEKGRWGESYVGYGYRAGIIAGMNANTFAPTANVTGTQFLKMALVTLGYDQEAEGFVGSSWAVNVLALAKRIDLIDGLNDGWKPEADLTRQEAAQILLNTLNASTVEYGQEAKAFINREELKKELAKNDYFRFDGKLYLTIAGAVETGKELYKSFGLKKDETDKAMDAFGRPYTKWTLDDESVSVMKPVKATFTTKFSACDLLVALGVKESDMDTEIVVKNVYVNGVENGSELLTENEGKYVARTWSHSYSNCRVAKEAVHGAQGTLTQVFYMGKDEDGNKTYRVCSIDTWLAEVKTVTTKATARDEHLRDEGTVTLKTVFTTDNKDDGFLPAYCEDGNATEARFNNKGQCEELSAKTLKYDDPTGIEKGDYVLITYSWMKDKDGVQSADVVEGKDGRFNGFKKGNAYTDPTETRIDGEYVKDAVHFHLGYKLSKDADKFGTYTFYYDAYGNVIGMEESKDASTWAVIDRAWTIFDNEGETYLNAKVADLDAKLTNGIVKKFTDINDYEDVFVWDSDVEFPTSIDQDNLAYELAVALKNFTNGESKKDFNTIYDHLVKVTTDSEGKFSIKVAKKDDKGVVDIFGDLESVKSNGTVLHQDNEIELVNGRAYMLTETKEKIVLTSKTQFLVHKMDGTYASYTGYKNVPSMIAHYAEVVYDTDNDKIVADVVYLANDVYMTDGKLVAYVGKPATDYVVEVKDGVKYHGLTIYVDGEAKDVLIDEDDLNDFSDLTGGTFKQGFFEFQNTDIDADTVVRCLKVSNELDNYLDAPVEVTYFGDEEIYVKTANEDGETIYEFADGIAYYLIDTDDCEVEKSTLEDLQYFYGLEKITDPTPNGPLVKNAHDVYMALNADGDVTAIYLIVEYND